MQAMFIDVDGTLSSPCYKVNGKFQIGMSDVQWQTTALSMVRIHMSGAVL